MLPLLKQVLDNFNFDVDPDKSRDENADEVIKAAALLSGAIAVEPLPFADMLLITPVQLKMVLHVGKIYGFEITSDRAREIVTELGATLAYGFAARQLMRGVVKLVAPVIGGIVTAPLVYGWTFGLGRLAETYFQRKVQNLPFERTDRVKVVQEAQRSTKRLLPSADDFSQLARELRKRAQDKERSAGEPPRDLN